MKVYCPLLEFKGSIRLWISLWLTSHTSSIAGKMNTTLFSTRFLIHFIDTPLSETFSIFPINLLSCLFVWNPAITKSSTFNWNGLKFSSFWALEVEQLATWLSSSVSSSGSFSSVARSLSSLSSSLSTTSEPFSTLEESQMAPVCYTQVLQEVFIWWFVDRGFWSSPHFIEKLD